MKRCIKRAATVLMAVVLFVTPGLSVFAAEPECSRDREGDRLETAIQVSGSFRVDKWVLNSVYYRYIPKETGYYTIAISQGGVGATVREDDYDLLYPDQHRTYKDDKLTSYQRLVAGWVYYITLYSAETFNLKHIITDVDITYIGEIDSVTVLRQPDRLIYYDAVGYHYEVIQDDEYPSMNYIALDISGAQVEVSFASGDKIVLEDDEIEGFFEYVKCPEEVIIGTNTVSYVLNDIDYLSFDYTVIENPVEYIEIVSLPEKITYVSYKGRLYWFSEATGKFGYGMNYEGVKLQISYKDGTDETITIPAFELIDGYEYKGYDMILDAGYMYSTDGSEGWMITAQYLSNSTICSMNVSDANLIQKLSCISLHVADTLEDIGGGVMTIVMLIVPVIPVIILLDYLGLINR